MRNRLVRGLVSLIATFSLSTAFAAALWGMSAGIPQHAFATIACGTPIELLSNGGFESPVVEDNVTTPDGWSGGHITNLDANSGSQSVVLALDFSSTTQTINVSGLEGMTLTFSAWAHGGGSMSIGSSSIDVGWNQPNWGFHSVDYVVQPGDTTIDVTLDGGQSQGSFDDASVTYALPCPETPTPEPTEVIETPEPTEVIETPTEVVEPTGTEVPSETPAPTEPTTDETPTVAPDDNQPTAVATATGTAVSLPNTGTGTGAGPTSSGTPLAAIVAGITILSGFLTLGWVMRRHER